MSIVCRLFSETYLNFFHNIIHFFGNRPRSAAVNRPQPRVMLIFSLALMFSFTRSFLPSCWSRSFHLIKADVRFFRKYSEIASADSTSRPDLFPPGPASWPSDDRSSSPILLNQNVDRISYPKNRLVIFPNPFLKTADDWRSFQDAIAKQLPDKYEHNHREVFNAVKLFKVRLKGDYAPDIINSGEPIRWNEQDHYFHPFRFGPKFVPARSSSHPASQKIIVRNLCLGWDKQELNAFLADAFKHLGLKGSYHCDAAIRKYSWTYFTFYQFEFEEDANKVLERYGNVTVMENPGTGLIFENCELSLAKIKSVAKADKTVDNPNITS
jgi:hypothetical protein